MNLNQKDKKILSALDLNARASLQQIAKVCHCSKEVVFYHIRKLEQDGIIQRYTTLVNFAKLGYTGFAVFTRLHQCDTQKREEIIAYLSTIPQVYWVALVGGRFDLVFGLLARNVFEFNTLYYSIISKYSEFFTDTRISIRTELRQNQRGYLTTRKDILAAVPFFGKEPTPETIDSLDEQILSLISNNARFSIVDVSRLLKTPASTISARWKALEKKKIIQGYATYIKVQEVGMQSYRLLLSLTNMDTTFRKALFSYVWTNPNMILAIETVGEWNFEITLEVSNSQQLQQEMSQLRQTFPSIIKSIDFLIMFEDDLIYDPYPFKKNERKRIIPN